MNMSEGWKLQTVDKGELQRASARRPWLLTAGLGLVTLVLVVVHPYVKRLNAPPTPLPLQVTDVGGSLTIRWDTEHPAVQQSDAARIVVQDAGRSLETRLDAAALRRGAFTHARSGNDVLVTVTLTRGSQPIAIASVRSVGR